MIKLKLKKDFATKKAGTVWEEYDSQLAARLIRRGIAEVYKVKRKKK